MSSQSKLSLFFRPKEQQQQQQQQQPITKDDNNIIIMDDDDDDEQFNHIPLSVLAARCSNSHSHINSHSHSSQQRRRRRERSTSTSTSTSKNSSNNKKPKRLQQQEQEQEQEQVFFVSAKTLFEEEKAQRKMTTTTTTKTPASTALARSSSSTTGKTTTTTATKRKMATTPASSTTRPSTTESLVTTPSPPSPKLAVPFFSTRRAIYSSSSVDTDMDMDIEEEEQEQQETRILHWLIHRTTTTTTGARRPRTVVPNHVMNMTTFTSPPWMQLLSDTTATTRSTTGRKPKVLQLAWDPTGVLLAVALANQTIQIYDVDMMRAAHLQGQRENNLQQQADLEQQPSSLFALPPILSWKVPFGISTILWHPTVQDALLCGFGKNTATTASRNNNRNNNGAGRVYWYHVDKISTWMDSKTTHASSNTTTLHNNNNPFPPPETYMAFWNHNAPDGNLAVVNLHVLKKKKNHTEDTLLLVNCGTMIYGWKKHGRKMSLLWRLDLKPLRTRASCIASLPLHQDSCFFFVATNQGTILLVDPTRPTRERAFSSQLRPTIVWEWTLPSSILQQQGGGILDLQFQTPPLPTSPQSLSLSSLTTTLPTTTTTSNTTNNPNPEKKATTTKTLVVADWRMTLVTTRGFVLETTLSSSSTTINNNHKKRPSLQIDTLSLKIISRPPGVEYRNAQGTVLPPKSNGNNHNNATTMTYSVPQYPLVVATSNHYQNNINNNDVLCWPAVPQTKTILGHHDKYVLMNPTTTTTTATSSSRITDHDDNQDDKGNTAVVLNYYRPTTGHLMEVPLNKTNIPPQAMAIHPQEEWIILGIQDELVILRETKRLPPPRRRRRRNKKKRKA